MRKLIIITISILYTSFALAKSSYQIDMIIFAHPQNANQTSKTELNLPFLPMNNNAITLGASTGKSSKSYQLLAPSQSKLSNEYYLLSRKSHYKVLGHYSWIQPASGQSTIALPKINHNGWQIQGTARVRQSNYYLFDSALQCSSPSNPDASFTVSQKQRLKGGVAYYLDHAQVGMLIKIHNIKTL